MTCYLPPDGKHSLSLVSVHLTSSSSRRIKPRYVSATAVNIRAQFWGGLVDTIHESILSITEQGLKGTIKYQGGFVRKKIVKLLWGHLGQYYCLKRVKMESLYAGCQMILVFTFLTSSTAVSSTQTYRFSYLFFY